MDHLEVLLVGKDGKTIIADGGKDLPEILFITSFPPRECGIATYSQDLIKALDYKFHCSFKIRICPLESETEKHSYADDIQDFLNTDHPDSFRQLSENINNSDKIRIVLIQHEFGFFEKCEDVFNYLLFSLEKPVVIVFHTVLPHPNDSLKTNVINIALASESIIVMTNSSRQILIHDYGVPEEKITVIPHGTHLVPHSDKNELKAKYGLEGRKVLSTFGLLSSGKNIETTLRALPFIINENPEVLFLVIGKTHPTVLHQDGEKYRAMLEGMVQELQLEQNVRFVNHFLPLSELLEYLQLTDIYLFTSKDPNQAVSGTFSYAISCGCPIISTPIPHAREVLRDDAGIIIDFQNPDQLATAVCTLLSDETLRNNISSNGLHRIASTAWENAAITHAILFEKIDSGEIVLFYTVPEINLDHIKKLTTEFGMIQFSKINKPDRDSGYTIDDNARALIALCQHFELTEDGEDIKLIFIYFNFLKHCLQPDGRFMNYVDLEKNFTEQNSATNLDDSNGRAIWALGYLNSLSPILPRELVYEADLIMQSALLKIDALHSTRAMAFTIKGLYYRNIQNKSSRNILLIKEFANRLVQMYRHEKDEDWHWYESYLTYANSVIPEAMLCAWSTTGNPIYREIAESSFTFLLSKIFHENSIKVVSNKTWLHKEEEIFSLTWGEQPIDIAYTVLALNRFFDVFKDREYLDKMESAFDWFLGRNHLHQIIYNPCTGGCYDGLEENNINLNQGAESTVSYLLARLTIENRLRENKPIEYGKNYILGSSLQVN